MVGWHEVVKLRYREEAFLHCIRSTHPYRSSIAMNALSITSTPYASFTRGRISTAC
jgi:precorrin-6x reductase